MEKLGFDATAKICPICKEPKNQLMGIIIHLAQKHEQLKGLIESEILENLWKNLSRIKVILFESILFPITHNAMLGKLTPYVIRCY